MTSKVPEIIRWHLYDKEDAPAKKLNQYVNLIDNNYYDDIQRDINKLNPDDTLNPNLREKVLNDFRKHIADQLNANFEGIVLADIKGSIPVNVAQNEINALINVLQGNANLLRKFISSHHKKYTEEEINRLYKNALRITPLEWLLGNNKRDVIKFHHALQDDTVEKVHDLIEISFADFMDRIANRLKEGDY